MVKKIAKFGLISLLLVLLGLGLYFYFSFKRYVDFRVSSQVEGKELRLTNQIKLTKYLKKLELYKGVKMPIIGEFQDMPIPSVTVDKVNVVYVDKEQKFMKSYGTGGVMMSSYGQVYEEDSRTMNVYIYVNSKVIDGGDEVLSQSIEYTTIKGLFELVNYSKYGSANRPVRMREFLKNTIQKETKRPVFLEITVPGRAFSIVGTVYAGCTGDYSCGTYQCICSSNGLSCSGDGTPCNYGSGICDCSTCVGDGTSQKPCELKKSEVSCLSGTGTCPSGGCTTNYSCSWSCDPVDGGWSSWSNCYSNGSICIKDRACNNPSPSCGGADCVGYNWTYCSGPEVGCNEQSCPTWCDYDGGSVNNGDANGSCGCAQKSCPATARCCTPTNPDAPVLSSPANAVQVRVNQAVTLGWGAISNWGTGCPSNTNRYEMCVMSGSVCDLVNYASTGTNTTYSWTPTAADAVVTWKVRSNNGSNTNESGTRTVCVEGGLTYGAWSACNASTHKRTRTCTETCGTDDCTAAGAVGGVITQDCVGTIQGALFDASDMTTCPADLISNPGNYSGVLIANMSFNMTSPFGPPSWPGVNAATRTLTTNVNGFYTVNAYAPGTYTYDFSALAGTYIPVPRFNCTSAAAGLPGCSSADMSQPCATASLPNMSFGFWRIYGGWWQATGGNVYAKNGLGSAIPASVPAANQRLILSDSFGRSGMLSHGFAWAGTELGTNPNASVSTPLWRIQSTYNGLRYDFDYYQTRMDVFESTAWDGGAINYDDLGVGYQIFKHTGDVTLGYSGPTGTQKAVLLIDGNVTINTNITVPDGAFLGVVASGNITINPNVTTAQGWFVGRNINFPCSDDAAPLGTCDTDDVQFVGEGSFVGWTTINLDRDMGVGNNSAPSESFRYRPDMYLNVPDPMKVYTKRFTPFIP